MAVSLLAQKNGSQREYPKRRANRFSVSGDDIPVLSGSARASQLAHVFSGRGIHALGDQRRRSYGAAVWLNLDRQFGRVLRDLSHDPRQQYLCAAIETEEVVALLRIAVAFSGRKCWCEIGRASCRERM